MIKRWRMILAGVLVILATAVGIGVMRDLKDRGVALIFVGFTNRLVSTTARFQVHVDEAMFILTNKGSGHVELTWEIRPENCFTTNGGLLRIVRRGFCWPIALGPPAVLKPGEGTILFGSIVGPWTNSWTAEIGYRELSALQRFDRWMRNKAGPRTWRMLDRIFSRPSIRWAAVGPVSTQPPPPYTLRFGVDFGAPQFDKVDFRFNPADAFDPVNLPKDWRPHITEPPLGS